MKNLSNSFVVIDCFLLAAAVISKFVSPMLLKVLSMKAISFVVLANTSFLLAVIFKK